LAVDARGEQALVGRLVVGEEPALGQDPREPSQLPRVLVHLTCDLTLPALQLLLQRANLAVPVQQVAETRRAHDLELALPPQQALGLDPEPVHDARGGRRRARPATPALPAPGLAPQPPQLDADRPA